MVENEQVVQYLSYLTKSYDGVTKLIAQTKQRYASLPDAICSPENDDILKGQGKAEGLLTVKGRLNRAIARELPQWDVWNKWLQHVPGVGPWYAAKLILLFNYKFAPVCRKCGGFLTRDEGGMFCEACGEPPKGDGVFKFKMLRRDFPTVSRWWAYMGRHIVDGKMPKRKSGVQSNWSTEGRTLTYLIGSQFNKLPEHHLYKAFLLERRKKHFKNHPEWTKGHNLNAAQNETVKLFLSHFWHVSRLLEGKSVTSCYAEGMLGHEHIIPPYYFEEERAAA